MEDLMLVGVIDPAVLVGVLMWLAIGVIVFGGLIWLCAFVAGKAWKAASK
jgi:hypothetical protein